MTYPIRRNAGFVPCLSRLDELALRMANAVIDRTYSSAREAAVHNVVEYAGSETTDEAKLHSRIGNFAKKITNTLEALKRDKFGDEIL